MSLKLSTILSIIIATIGAASIGFGVAGIYEIDFMGQFAHIFGVGSTDLVVGLFSIGGLFLIVGLVTGLVNLYSGHKKPLAVPVVAVVAQPAEEEVQPPAAVVAAAVVVAQAASPAAAVVEAKAEDAQPKAAAPAAAVVVAQAASPAAAVVEAKAEDAQPKAASPAAAVVEAKAEDAQPKAASPAAAVVEAKAVVVVAPAVVVEADARAEALEAEAAEGKAHEERAEGFTQAAAAVRIHGIDGLGCVVESVVEILKSRLQIGVYIPGYDSLRDEIPIDKNGLDYILTVLGKRHPGIVYITSKRGEVVRLLAIIQALLRAVDGSKTPDIDVHNKPVYDEINRLASCLPPSSPSKKELPKLSEVLAGWGQVVRAIDQEVDQVLKIEATISLLRRVEVAAYDSQPVGSGAAGECPLMRSVDAQKGGKQHIRAILECYFFIRANSRATVGRVLSEVPYSDGKELPEVAIRVVNALFSRDHDIGPQVETIGGQVSDIDALLSESCIRKCSQEKYFSRDDTEIVGMADLVELNELIKLDVVLAVGKCFVQKFLDNSCAGGGEKGDLFELVSFISETVELNQKSELSLSQLTLSAVVEGDKAYTSISELSDKLLSNILDEYWVCSRLLESNIVLLKDVCEQRIRDIISSSRYCNNPGLGGSYCSDNGNSGLELGTTGVAPASPASPAAQPAAQPAAEQSFAPVNPKDQQGQEGGINASIGDGGRSPSLL